MAQLVIHLPDGPPQVHELVGERVTLGRYSDNTIVIDDPSVSNHHAELKRRHGRWQLRDLGSTNGTFVQGNRIEEITLELRSTINFGNVRASINEEGNAVGCVGDENSPSLEQSADILVHPTVILSGRRIFRAVATLVALTLPILAAVLVIAIAKHAVKSDYDKVRTPTLSKHSQEETLSVGGPDSGGNLEIIIRRVLLGESTVTSGVLYPFHLEQARSSGKEVIYFELSFHNKGRAKHYVNQHAFSLEDLDGFSYHEEQTRDTINGNVLPGATSRGGIAFYVPKQSAPRVLYYDAGEGNVWSHTLTDVSLFSGRLQAGKKDAAPNIANQPKNKTPTGVGFSKTQLLRALPKNGSISDASSHYGIGAEQWVRSDYQLGVGMRGPDQALDFVECILLIGDADGTATNVSANRSAFFEFVAILDVFENQPMKDWAKERLMSALTGIQLGGESTRKFGKIEAHTETIKGFGFEYGSTPSEPRPNLHATAFILTLRSTMQ